MNENWNSIKMGIESCIDGKSKIEIDEFITYDGRIIRWMFWLVERGQYDIRIF